MDRTKPKIEIPALTAGTSGSHDKSKIPLSSKELAIQALEAKLKQLEGSSIDFELNKANATDPPLIQKYQFNKDKPLLTQTRTKYSNKHRQRSSNPYSRNNKR